MVLVPGVMQGGGGKDQGGSGIRQKLGLLLHNLSSRSSASQRPEEVWRQEQVAFFTNDVVKELGAGVALPQRLRTMRELHEIVSTKKLEANAVQVLWLAVRDMLEKDQPQEVRHSTLVFLRAIVAGQSEELGILRAHFFRVVQQCIDCEDFQLCFDIVKTLTEAGKHILHIEEEIGPFLASCMRLAMKEGRLSQYLNVLVNMVKYNSVYMDEDTLMKLIQGCHKIATSSEEIEVLELCLLFLNTVVCYSSLPASCLTVFVTTLCHTLNFTRISSQSLDMMLRLLGTHSGHATIHTMCSLLRERQLWSNPFLLRGGVFYISMSLWGVQRVETLQISFSSVLPAIREVSQCDHTIVLYEVALSMQRLVRKYAHSLETMDWDAIYAILEAVQSHAHHHFTAQPNHALVLVLQDLFSIASELHDGSHFSTDPEKFYAVVESSLWLQLPPIVLQLMAYHMREVRVGETGWLEQLNAFFFKFYQQKGTRTVVRLEALKHLSLLVGDFSLIYEKELMEGVVLPLLSTVAEDSNEDVRCQAVQLLQNVVQQCSPHWAAIALSLIKSVLQLDLVDALAVSPHKKVSVLRASEVAVGSLIHLLEAKLMSSSDTAAQAFNLLVHLLEQHYFHDQCFFPAACSLRKKIFNAILSLRAGEDGRLGYHDNSGTNYSLFYVCQRDAVHEGEESGLVRVFLDYQKAFSITMECLSKERDWSVIKEMLLGLVPVLQDRVLTLSSAPDLSALCLQLCRLLNPHQQTVGQLQHSSGLKPEDELASHVYPVLVCFCSYGRHLKRHSQQALFTALENGVVGKCALLCLRSLSSCALEMQLAAARELPRIVLRLGQVSATPSMAWPVLEFLAGLVVLPHLYSDFVEQEYLEVFGIALPYTDSSKYSNYIVSLAHRVIAMWFIRCRIQYRPTVAKFITQSLSTLIIVHQELTGTRQWLGSSGPSSPSATMTGKPRSHNHDSEYPHSGAFPPLLTDMTEVCLDMMAHYTYSNISSQPLRSPGVDFLVGEGSSKTWLVGRSLVTITTSGSGGGEQGVCGRCRAVKRILQPNAETTLTSNEAYLTRHRASLVGQEEAVSPSLCSCWCRGWAEIKVRRPTGSVAWLMRVQNKLDIQATSLISTQADLDWSLMSLNEPGARKEEEEQEEEEQEQEEEEQEQEEEWGILTVEEDDFFGVEALPKAMTVQKESKNEQAINIEHTSDNEQTNGFKQTSGVEQSDKFEQADKLQLAIGIEQAADITDASSTRCPVSERIEETKATKHPAVQSVSIEQRGLYDQADSHLEGSFGFIPHRQPSSHSWSESEAPPFINRRDVPRSYSLTCSSLNQLPPLFSYDEGDLLRRSPSLHASGELTEPEQLQLLTSVSRTTMIPADADVQDRSSSTDEEQNATVASHDNSADDFLPLADLTHSLQLSYSRSSSCSSEKTPVPSSPTASSLLTPTPAVTLSGSFSYTSAPNTSSPASHRKRVKFSQPLPRRQHAAQDQSDWYKNPAFIFLQLYHSPCLRLGAGVQDLPVLLPSSEVVERAVKVLDRIPPYDTHKIGVVYVGEGQVSEHKILANTLGSSRYQQMLSGLGRLVTLHECSPDLVYLGGLDTSGTDGDLACVWEDDITQVVFHVATLLPTLPNNPHCSNKKLHIGNDFVTVVYNNSGQQYMFGTIKGQFNYAEVQVDPLTEGINRVTLSVCSKLQGMLDSQPCLVSDQWLPVLVRQKALLANLASLVLLSESTSDHYPSNWLERLRQIRHIRERCLAEQREQGSELPVPDFTTYC